MGLRDLVLIVVSKEVGMKYASVLAVLALALNLSAQQLALSDARAKLGEAIADPSVMASLVQQLPAADQKAFVAEANAAIAKMPGSPETKAASFLDANRAALKGAQKGTVADMLAEIFATASLESLTVINEQFASDVFNRSLNPSVTYTDEQYVKLAQDTLAKIAARNADVDDGAVRTGFAILMFVRASNGSPAGLADTLAAALPENVRETAKTEWFPAALAEGDGKSYDPMLGNAEDPIPNGVIVCRLAHAQSLNALLDDLAAGKEKLENLATLNVIPYSADRGGIDAGLDNGLYRLPFYYNRKVYGTTAGQKGSGRKIGGGSQEPGVPGGVPVGPGGKPVGPGGREIEPGGYPSQY